MIRDCRKSDGRLHVFSVLLVFVALGMAGVDILPTYADDISEDQNESALEMFSRKNKTTFDPKLVTGSFSFQNDVIFRGTFVESTASKRGDENSSERVAVFRREGLTMRAWRRSDRKTFFANIEKGLEQGRSKYRRRRFTNGRIEGIPYLDIEFTYRANARSGKTKKGAKRFGYVRYLLFRRFAMVAVVDGAKRARSKRRRFVKSFVPKLGIDGGDDES